MKYGKYFKVPNGMSTVIRNNLSYKVITFQNLHEYFLQVIT